MNIAVLGTGMVGQALAGRLTRLGHTVAVGTRDPDATLARTEPDGMGNPPFAAWHADHADVALTTFADAAAGADLVVLAGNGFAAIDMLTAAGAAQPRRQAPARHLQPAGLLGRLPAEPVRQGHRLARRADPGGLPRGQGREVPQHPHRTADGGPGPARRGDHRVRVG